VKVIVIVVPLVLSAVADNGDGNIGIGVVAGGVACDGDESVVFVVGDVAIYYCCLHFLLAVVLIAVVLLYLSMVLVLKVVVVGGRDDAHRLLHFNNLFPLSVASSSTSAAHPSGPDVFAEDRENTPLPATDLICSSVKVMNRILTGLCSCLL